ncbi:hypothetical protein [Pseudoroseomonas sp. WGS1072]|uniref:hypothetical protein n=1 Tax=Roseomonas sp. WGS1072 TaxID=3366816 RepID=UPI003BF127FC
MQFLRAIQPAWLRREDTRRWLFSIGAAVVYVCATIAVLRAIYAPTPSAEERLAALLCAPAAMMPALWRSARLSAGQPAARLLSWRRVDCLLVSYLLGGAALTCSVGAATLLALHGEERAPTAILLFGLGAGAVLATGIYFRYRLEQHQALSG